MVKSAAHFGAPKPSYGHFSYPAGHSRGKVSSQKNTQNGNKSRFPGATCIFSNFCERQNRRARNSASDGQKCRAFGAPKPSYGHFSYPAGHRWGKVSSRKTPKMAINRDFPGLRAFSAIFARDKIEEREIPHPMVKSAAHFGAPKPSYGHFSYPASHSRGKVSSRKTPKMAINRDFPGLRAFSAIFATDKIEEREIPHPMVTSAAHFGAPKPSYGHFSYPAGRSRGKVSSQKKNTQNGNKSRFPGATCIFSNFCERDKIEEREIPHLMVKSAAHFGAPKPSYGHFSYPAGHSWGKVSSQKKTPKMAINRDFPGLRAFSAIFARDKIEEREIPHPMVKSASHFGAPKRVAAILVTRPAAAGGRFQAKKKHPKWQ